MVKGIAALVVAGWLAGCATSPAALEAPGAGLSSVPVSRLCAAYFSSGDPKFVEELGFRSAFAPADLVAISGHTLRVGMASAAADCSRPDHVATTAGQAPGVSKWLLYDSGGFAYLSAGVVTAYRL